MHDWIVTYVLWWACLFVCLSICLSVCEHISKLEVQFQSSPNCCACYLWPWLGLPLVALWYVMYFRFLEDVISPHNGSCGAGDASRVWVKATDQTAVPIWHRGVYSNRLTWGSAGPGAKSDVYSCFIVWLKCIMRYFAAELRECFRRVPLTVFVVT